MQGVHGHHQHQQQPPGPSCVSHYCHVAQLQAALQLVLPQSLLLLLVVMAVQLPLLMVVQPSRRPQAPQSGHQRVHAHPQPHRACPELHLLRHLPLP